MPQLRQHPRPSLPKTLTSALLALSVVASSLLAVAIAAALPVALSDPTPAAASIHDVITTAINIDYNSALQNNAANNKRSTDHGITHTLTSSNCDMPAGGQGPVVTTTESNTTAGAAIDEPNNTANKIFNHHIDYRCDWKFSFTSADGCDINITPHGLGAPLLSGAARSGHTAQNTITLRKNPDYPTAHSEGGGNNAIRKTDGWWLTPATKMTLR